MAQSRWRINSRETIRNVLMNNQYTQQKVLINMIRNAYPFVTRENTPYQIWLDEVKLVKHFLAIGQPYHQYLSWVNQFRGYKDFLNNQYKPVKQVYIDPNQLTLF